MRTKKAFLILLALALCGTAVAEGAAVPYWREDSPALQSIVAFVDSVTDEASESYLPPEDRVAVFDFDGTLYGERFPTYFDTCLFIHRVLHDESCTAEPDVLAYAQELETALLNGDPEPDSPRSTAQMAAEVFRGFTPEEYAAYIREFADTPAYGFENMTYGEGFFLPMTAIVEYLADHGFTVFISSGSERTIVRVLIEGKLDRWVPSDRVIGSTFSLTASGQEDKAGRSYDFRPEDEVLLEGNLTEKNQKTNKVFTIVYEIGRPPVLVFGNSSGDLSMAQYAAQHGGKAYMLLCDDTERDYGDPETAASFAETCASAGYETISMRDEFETIYAPDVRMAEAGMAEEGMTEESMTEVRVFLPAA